MRLGPQADIKGKNSKASKARVFAKKRHARAHRRAARMLGPDAPPPNRYGGWMS